MDRRTNTDIQSCQAALLTKGHVVWCFPSTPFQPVSTVSGTHWLETVCLSANMFRSCWGLHLPNFPLLPPCVLKIRSNCGPDKTRPLQYCSAATGGPLHLCSPDGSGHDVVTQSSVFPKRSYKWSFWKARSLFHLGPLEVPIGLCSPRSSFCCKCLPLFFPTVPFFLERSGIDTLFRRC